MTLRVTGLVKGPTLNRFNREVALAGQWLVSIGLTRLGAALIEIAVEPDAKASVPRSHRQLTRSPTDKHLIVSRP